MRVASLILSLLSLCAVALAADADAPSKKVTDVVELTDENFDELSGAPDGSKGIWFVKFYAPWCGHCKALAPKWEQLATKVKGKVNIADAECTDPAKDNCERFGVQGYPTLILFKDGQMYNYEGARELSDLEKFVNGGYATAVPAPVPRLPTAFDKLMKNVYMIDDYVRQLWQSSRLTVLFLIGSGFVLGFITKAFMTPKVKERVKLMKVETKKLK